MKTVLVASVAYTTHANTPITDAEAKVMHTVKDQFHTAHQVMAECPMTAIEQFNARKIEIEQPL